MGLLPLPSHVHYELLLQLLERQTLPALEMGTEQYLQVQQMIIHLRKALSAQKQLEKSCQDVGLYVEHRWSLNVAPPTIPAHLLATPAAAVSSSLNLPPDLPIQPTTPLNPA
jgi:hypothetical protein